MLQLWQHLIEIGSGLLRRELLVGHMGDENLQELLHAVIGELAVGIAPLTVVLVEAAVQIPADDLITVQGHTTALTDQLARVTQQKIDGGIKQCGQLLQCFRVGDGLAVAVIPSRHPLLPLLYLPYVLPPV